MSEGESSISKARTYKEISEFWDTHDLSDYWEKTYPVEFEVNIQSSVMYFPIEITLSEKVRSIAERRGVSPETLINLWVQEKVLEEGRSAQ